MKTNVQINEMTNRILEAIIEKGCTNELIVKVQYIAEIASTGTFDGDVICEFADYSQEDAKDLAKWILKKAERMLKECERSYYLTACIIEMLRDLNELENLQYTTKKIEICKELVPLFIDDEDDIEAGVLRMKILD